METLRIENSLKIILCNFLSNFGSHKTKVHYQRIGKFLSGGVPNLVIGTDLKLSTRINVYSL